MFNDIGDAPDIARCLQTGYPDGDPEYPHCPVCGSECETIYKDIHGDVFGCEECVSTRNAWDIEECF